MHLNGGGDSTRKEGQCRTSLRPVFVLTVLQGGKSYVDKVVLISGISMTFVDATYFC